MGSYKPPYTNTTHAINEKIDRKCAIMNMVIKGNSTTSTTSIEHKSQGRPLETNLYGTNFHE